MKKFVKELDSLEGLNYSKKFEGQMLMILKRFIKLKKKETNIKTIDELIAEIDKTIYFIINNPTKD